MLKAWGGVRNWDVARVSVALFERRGSTGEEKSSDAPRRIDAVCSKRRSRASTSRSSLVYGACVQHAVVHAWNDFTARNTLSKEAISFENCERSIYHGRLHNSVIPMYACASKMKFPLYIVAPRVLLWIFVTKDKVSTKDLVTFICMCYTSTHAYLGCSSSYHILGESVKASNVQNQPTRPHQFSSIHTLAVAAFASTRGPPSEGKGPSSESKKRCHRTLAWFHTCRSIWILLDQTLH